MSIEQPEVTDTALSSVTALRDKLQGLNRRGVICHCCRFSHRTGSPITRLMRRPAGGEEVEIGRWDFRIDADHSRVLMRRSAIGDRLSQVAFSTDDTNEELRDKILQAIEDIRQASGVQASAADYEALKAVVDSELA